MSKRNLFEKRVEAKPYEYPELIDFKDAIRHSYWLSSEFNFSSDIQDYHVNVTPAEKSVLTKAMLAIAQVEVSVKRFWSDLYKYFPKPEIDLVGVTFGECHIEGTEILTPSGWKDFRDIEVGDLVAQFNPEDKTSEFVPATRVIKAPYNGPMYRFHKRKWECVVTPNHRMLDYDRNGKIRVREARNFWSDSKGTKPFTSYKRGVVNELSDMDRLKIAIQADGHHLYSINKHTGERVYRVTPDGCYIYSIKLAKERKIERLFKILEYTGVPFRHHVDKHNHHIFDIYTPKENYKNFDWVDLADKSCWWCNEFVEELSHWDGYRIEGKKDCWIKYSSTNKSCADKVQAVGTLAGYWATMNTYVDPRSERYQDIHTVSFINNRDSVHHNHDTDVFQYSGMVYCVTVPSGFIITRYKDTVSIEGNSECYSSDTEILTERGWAPFPQLERGVKVATYNVLNNTIIFDRPYDYIEKDHDGYMHLYQSRNTNFLVTEDHELYVKNRQSGAIKRRKSKTILSMKNYSYPSSGMLDGEDRVLTYLERLLIAIQADGTVFAECPSLKGTGTTRISFGFHKPKKMQRLKYLLDRLHITYQTRLARRNQTVITFSLKELAEGLDFSTLKSFDWVDITKINASWGREFIRELSYWDCHINRHGSYAYYNANIDALNKVQAIAALSGYRTKLHLYRRAEDCLKILLPDGTFRKTAKDQYRLNITDIEQTTYPGRDVIRYSGKVYCVSVPSGAIVTRRNGIVGINFQCRHFDAYSDLLEKLGMNDMFSNIREYPALMGRVDYIENFLSNKELSKSHFILSLIMFSLFVEHISLFGQFLVIMSFNKHKNMFKGISNAIEATSKEEEIHGRFGIALYGILKEEHPELFTEEFYQELTSLAYSALKAEKAILHWIFEEGDLDFIDLATAENYIIHRYNNSLEILGIEAPYLVDERLLAKTRWFDEEVLSGKENDFFYKRSTDYSKKQKQITADDLF